MALEDTAAAGSISPASDVVGSANVDAADERIANGIAGILVARDHQRRPPRAFVQRVVRHETHADHSGACLRVKPKEQVGVGPMILLRGLPGDLRLLDDFRRALGDLLGRQPRTRTRRRRRTRRWTSLGRCADGRRLRRRRR
jgi:hypothetical protein